MRPYQLLTIMPFAVLAIAAIPAHAAGWTVSCTVGGTVVHVETLSEETAEKREREIRARYPTAACVFLSDAMMPATPMADLGGGGAGPYDLEAALRAISGERLDVAFPAPQPVVEPLDHVSMGETAVSVTAPSDHRPETAGWIRLSMYRTENIADALADWSRITTAEQSFRFLTPSVARVDDEHVMLSVGPVATADKAAVCVAAVSLGLECLSGPELKDDHDLAVEYLAAVFPGTIVVESRDECGPAKPLADLAQPLPPGMTGGLTCWRSGFAADRRFASYDPTVVVDVSADIGLADISEPPLPRKRPVRTLAASE